MQIYIPSKGRAAKQHTLALLPQALRNMVTLVIYPEEALAYQQNNAGVPLLLCPKSVKNIGTKRQFIIENHNIKRYGPKLVMIDDDLSGFAVRRKDVNTRFQAATEKDVVTLFNKIEELLDPYPHVGVLGREGGCFNTDPVLFCTRMMRILAYDVRILRDRKIRFDRVPSIEDFDVHLQLLEHGYKTACIGTHVQDQKGSNTEGGCKDYRASRPNGEAARKLAQLHPLSVKVVEKKTKSSWGGGVRIDVAVQWKKAYQLGRAKKP